MTVSRGKNPVRGLSARTSGRQGSGAREAGEGPGPEASVPRPVPANLRKPKASANPPRLASLGRLTDVFPRRDQNQDGRDKPCSPGKPGRSPGVEGVDADEQAGDE